jgi:hypothetical protein
MKHQSLAGLLLIAAPAGALASSGTSSEAASRMECDRLISALEERSPADAHDALQRMRVFREGNKYQACIAAAQSARTGAENSNVQVGRILEMDVFNREGVQIGEVDRVARAGDRQVYIFATFRGPRWPGNKQVALPADRMMLQDGRLVISGIGEDELHRMPSVHQDGRNYTDLEPGATASLQAASPTETGSAGPRR